MNTRLNSINNELVALKSGELIDDALIRNFHNQDYARGSQFWGVPVAKLRALERKHRDFSISEIKHFLSSEVNDSRFFALIALVSDYERCPQRRGQIFDFYLRHRNFINNWNLTDLSAHKIVGAYLSDRDKSVLFRLMASDNIWDKRISLVASWWFIRHDHLDTTYMLTDQINVSDHHLIAQAGGWMLREAGKKDEARLVDYLAANIARLPRVSVRYAVENLPLAVRNKLKAL